MVKGLLIAAENGKLSLSLIEFDSLQDIYKALQCETIDHFNIDSPYGTIYGYCDDKGMLINKPVTITGIGQNIHGNALCFGGVTMDGYEMDITSEQTAYLFAHYDIVTNTINFLQQR